LRRKTQKLAAVHLDEQAVFAGNDGRVFAHDTMVDAVLVEKLDGVVLQTPIQTQVFIHEGVRL
jgi:hypothetical protein